ncbi:MAG: hypothetical protein ACRDRN_10670 [Sciscionella sp.]
MRLAVNRLVVGAGTAAILAGCVACGSSTAAATHSGSPSATTGGSAAGSAAPKPNAPEVNAAGDIPDTQVYVPFTPQGASFTVSVPQGWSRTAQGAATVFTDKYNSVRIFSAARSHAPDVASAKATELPKLKSSTPGYQAGKVSTVQRKSGPAVLITYTANSPASPVTGKTVTEAVQRYEFFKHGREVVLTLSGPTGADNVDPWRTITDSLRWH